MKEIFTALSKAQSEITGALKDSENPFYKSQYADLASVMTAIKEPFSKHGLCYSQITQFLDGQLYLETYLGHTSGESIKGVYPIFAKDNSPQAMGSAITYARRYALAAIAGVAQIDDDGESAMNRKSIYKEMFRPKDADPKVVQYQIPFGKWKGFSFSQIEKKEIENYYSFILNSLKDNPSKTTEQVKEFLERCEDYLNG